MVRARKGEPGLLLFARGPLFDAASDYYYTSAVLGLLGRWQETTFRAWASDASKTVLPVEELTMAFLVDFGWHPLLSCQTQTRR